MTCERLASMCWYLSTNQNTRSIHVIYLRGTSQNGTKKVCEGRFKDTKNKQNGGASRRTGFRVSQHEFANVSVPSKGCLGIT